jgi:hypothetical protein
VTTAIDNEIRVLSDNKTDTSKRACRFVNFETGVLVQTDRESGGVSTVNVSFDSVRHLKGIAVPIKRPAKRSPDAKIQPVEFHCSEWPELARLSGSLSFWDSPGEDLYSAKDGNPVE